MGKAVLFRKFTNKTGARIPPNGRVGSRFAGLLLLGGLVVFGLRSRDAQSADPVTISFIDRFQTNQVTVHFDTQPYRKYELQYTDALVNPGAGSNAWANLFVIPAQPFFNHW
ncbi:MAG TPA: hypothetical protein VHH73_13925, partial [Verrucomicrobiae bacterium]|nr:hypothetical protein [Verrucomicrobiae bacterium]